MRSTRETELADKFPAHVVCKWIGNSEPVASKHYLQVTDQHYQQAIEGALQNPVQQAHRAATTRTSNTTTPVFPRIATWCITVQVFR